jgi:hypothetical protein
LALVKLAMIGTAARRASMMADNGKVGEVT